MVLETDKSKETSKPILFNNRARVERERERTSKPVLYNNRAWRTSTRKRERMCVWEREKQRERMWVCERGRDYFKTVQQKIIP